MSDDKESYLNQDKTFNYIASVKPNQTLSVDSLDKYRDFLYNTTRLQQNNGRFEGFKASGKVGFIEDEKLQNNLMDLYQENIPQLLSSSDTYIQRKNEWFDFLIKNSGNVTDSTTNLQTILLTDEAQNLCGFLANTSEIINRYNVV